MTFRDIRMRLETLLGLYKTLVCKFSHIFQSNGDAYTSSDPVTAAADTTIPNKTFVVMDGTDMSFPEGQVWYKF